MDGCMDGWMNGWMDGWNFRVQALEVQYTAMIQVP